MNEIKVVHKNNFDHLIDLKDNQTPLNEGIVLIDDPRWESTLEEFKTCQIVACDLETMGAEKYTPLYFREGQIRLIQVGLKSGRTLIADLGGYKSNRELILSRYKTFLEILKQKLWDYRVIVLGANLKFDIVFLLYHFGMKTRQVRDVLTISRILWAGVGVVSMGRGADINRSERCQISHALKGVCQRLNIPISKEEQTSNWGWDLTNKQLNYAAYDVQVLFSCYEKLKELVITTGSGSFDGKYKGCSFSAKVECQAVSVWSEIEYYGSPVNIEKAKQFKILYEDALDKTLQPFRQTFPGVNYRSGPDLLEALNSKWPELRLQSTGVGVLGLIDKPEIQAVLFARTLETNLNFIDGVINYAWADKPDQYMAVRGFYQPNVPNGTGRSSCTDKVKGHKVGMSLQVIPGKILGSNLPPVRELVEAPSGYSMIICDLSGSHARFAAELSQAKMLLEIFNNDYDGHSILASFFSSQACDEYRKLKNSKEKVPDSLQEIINSSGEQFWTTDDIKKLKKSNEFAKAFRNAAKTTLYSCVPLSTKCLTKRGWKSHNEVEVGDEILAFDTKTKRNKWTPILKKHYYKDVPVIEWKVGKYKSFKSTPNHRWYGKKKVRRKTSCPTSFKYYKDLFFRTEEKTTENIILNTALAESGEGVSLSKTLNKYEEDNKWEVLVLSMTQEERWLFFSTCIATDGSTRKTHAKNTHTFVQDVTKQPELFEAVKLCGYLLGYNVSDWAGTAKTNCRTASFGPRQTTGMLSAKTIILENQDVWCVTTGLDTWIIRDEETKFMTITGNSLNGSSKSTILRAMQASGFVWYREEHAADAAAKFTDLYPELVSFCKNTPKLGAQVKRYFTNFLKNTKEESYLEEEHGMVQGKTGRYCFFPKKYGTKEWNKDRLEIPYTDSIAANWFLIESDVLAFWVYSVQKELDKFPEYKSIIFNIIHDEINLICLEEHVKEVAIICLKWLIISMQMWVKSLPVIEDGPDFSQVTNWDEWQLAFNTWVNTSLKDKEGNHKSYVWEQVVCKNYSEK